MGTNRGDPFLVTPKWGPWNIKTSPGSQVELQMQIWNKQPKEKVFRPEIPRTSRGHACRYPGSKTSGRPSKPGNPSIWARTSIRDGETTMKITFSLFEGGGGAWGGERKVVQNAVFFVGNATTIKFWKCKFYCREILLSLRRLLIHDPNARTSMTSGVCKENFGPEKLWADYFRSRHGGTS